MESTSTSKLRKLTFGKYKGQYILLIVAEHIGYIMWCLENLKWFKLNEDEQKFYDWQAIAIKKYNMPMIFPVETMYKHVKDQESLKCLKTPYQFIGHDPYIPETELTPLLKECGAIRKRDNYSTPLPMYDSQGNYWAAGLHHTMMKDLEWMSEEDKQFMDDMGFQW